MLNLELCKALKEAGLEVTDPIDAYCDLCGEPAGITEDTGFDPYCVNDDLLTAREHNSQKRFVLTPSLEELIEACGDEFRELRCTVLSPEKKWFAEGLISSLVRRTFMADSPAGAVARLYLALKEAK